MIEADGETGATSVHDRAIFPRAYLIIHTGRDSPGMDSREQVRCCARGQAFSKLA